MNRQELLQQCDPADKAEENWFESVLDRFALGEDREDLLLVPSLQFAAGSYSIAYNAAEKLQDTEPGSQEWKLRMSILMEWRQVYKERLNQLDPEGDFEFPDPPGEYLV